jgi:hypothetical protein
MINYVFRVGMAAPKSPQRWRNLVKLWREYGRVWVTIGKKA